MGLSDQMAKVIGDAGSSIGTLIGGAAGSDDLGTLIGSVARIGAGFIPRDDPDAGAREDARAIAEARAREAEAAARIAATQQNAHAGNAAGGGLDTTTIAMIAGAVVIAWLVLRK